MDTASFEKIRTLGENICIEFKQGRNGFEDDAFQTVCSFLNRFGGDLFLGVSDDGKVCGVPAKSAADMIRNFIKRISNPEVFSPTIYLVPEIIEYKNKTVIHVHVPPSVEVHTFKKDIYDRIDESDVKVKSTGSIAQMYIRKQNIYTEKKIYPFVSINDLREDLFPLIRVRAINSSESQKHPWNDITNEELLKSAGLYGTDHITGEKGYNLAAVLLLGKDEVIKDIVPAYSTDALLRKVNIDRYDDREIVDTNLVESYDKLIAFGRKHLLDKFFLEGEQRKSLRGIIIREMISNLLIHREFSSSYQAKFVIEKDKIYIENANRASQDFIITPNNLEPNPKNPIIANFFRNIGYADKLGSGVRNLFKYTKYYGGKDPIFEEKDIFKIIVPLDDYYFYDLKSKNNNEITQAQIKTTQANKHYNSVEIKNTTQGNIEITQVQNKTTQANEHYNSIDIENTTQGNKKNTQAQIKTTQANKHYNSVDIENTSQAIHLSDEMVSVLSILKEFPNTSIKNIALALRWKRDKAAYYVKKLKANGYIERVGSSQKGYWKVNEK
jgi:ATP-dependent DNA helicase RecG